MNRSIRLVLGAAALALVSTPTTAAAQAPTADEMRPVLDGLYSALASGDSAALGHWLAEDIVWTSDVSGAELTRGQVLSAAGRSAGAAARLAPDSVRVQRVGDVAFVSSRLVDRRSLAGVELSTRWRVLDAFVRRDGHWRLVRHAQTYLVAPVQARPELDSAALQAFVGRYEVAPGYVDDVHWDGGQLTATITGYPPGARLVPVSATVFSPDGVGALIAFERDATGQVVGYVQGYPDGRVVRRRKLP